MSRVPLPLILALLAATPAFSDAPNSCILIYEIQNPLPTCRNNTDVRAQRVAPDGALMWRGGLGVGIAESPGYERAPTAVPDRAGGAIVAFELKYNAGPRKNEVDICAQRVSASGRLLWNRGGPVAVASTRYREHAPVMVADGAGGAIVAFLVDVVHGRGKRLSGVCAQRISPDGTLKWLGGTRSLVVQEADARCSDLAIATDGAGGAFIAFRRLPATTGAASGPPRIVLRRVTADGELAWTAMHPAGLRLGLSADNPRSVQLIGDGLRGVWAIFVQGPTNRSSVMAQRIGPDAESKLAGRTLAVAGLASEFAAVPDDKGGFICVYATRADGGPGKLFGARIARNGRFAWGESGQVDLLTLAKMSCEEYAVAPSPGHGATVVLTTPVQGRGADGHRGLAAQRLNNLGKGLWGQTPVEVTNPSNASIFSPVALPDGRMGVYIAYVLKFTAGTWEGDTSIFGLRLNAEGKRVWKQPVGFAASPKPERAPILLPSL